MGTRIYVQLTIFITVHLAIFGGIIYVDRPLQFNEKLGGILIYSIFAFLNYRIMDGQIEQMYTVSVEIASLATDPVLATNGFVQIAVRDMDSGLFLRRNGFLIGGHILFYVIVLLSILFDKALSNMGPSKHEEAMQ